MIKKISTHIFNLLPIKMACFIQSKLLKGKIKTGEKSYVHETVHILGLSSVSVGFNSCISEGCWLNVNHRKEKKTSISIGNNCFIGKDNFFSCGKSIIICDYTLTTIGCKFIGSTHKIENPELPYLVTGTTSNDEIYIGVNCFFGAGTTILGNVTIGYGSIIGANSLVLNDIPPFSIVTGNPAKVIKRYSFDKKCWLSLSEMTTKDHDQMPTEQEYLAKLKKSHPKINIPWIAAGKSMGDI